MGTPPNASGPRADARRHVAQVRAVERRQQARLMAWLSVFVLLGGFAVAAANDDGTLPPGVFAEVTSGEVVLEDGSDERVAGVGDWIDVGVPFRADQTATVETNLGQVTFAAGSRASGSATLNLDVGEVLLSNDDTYFAVATRQLFAQASGTWRVVAGLNPRVAVYDGAGGTAVGRLGSRQNVGTNVLLSPFQEARGDGVEVAGPFPITYDRDDPWDAQLLAGPLAVDDEAAKIIRTAEQRWGTAPRPLEFYERFEVVDADVAEVLTRFATVELDDAFGEPGQILMATFAVRAIVDHQAKAQAVAVDLVDRRRAEGATWGIVLAMEGLGVDELLRVQDLALRADEEAPEPAPGPVCPAGTAPVGNDCIPIEQPCPDGQVRTDGECASAPCDAPNVLATDGSCGPCPGGTGYDAATEGCVPVCPSGELADGTCAEPCDAGQERGADGTCQPSCDDGSEYSDEHDGCVPVCGEGEELSDDGTECEGPPLGECLASVDPACAAAAVESIIEDLLDPDGLLDPSGPLGPDGLLGDDGPGLLPGDQDGLLGDVEDAVGGVLGIVGRLLVRRR